MPADAIPIALTLDHKYDAPQSIETLDGIDADLISKDIAYVVAAREEQKDSLFLWQVANSLSEHSHYLWQRAHVLRVMLHATKVWDSLAATRLYRGLQLRPLSDLRELSIGQILTNLFVAAILLHTPRLEVLDVYLVPDCDSGAHHIFDEATSNELSQKGLPFAQYPFRLRKLSFRGTDVAFFCHLYKQSRSTIKWLHPPLLLQPPQLKELLDQGNCVTTLLCPFGIFCLPDLALNLVSAFQGLRRLIVGASDLTQSAQLVVMRKSSLRCLVVGWYFSAGKCGSSIDFDMRLQEKGLENLLAVLPQLTLRELIFTHYRRDGPPSTRMPFSPRLLEDIRVVCQRRRTRITHSVATRLLDQY